jgi:hypothetical protein
MIFLMVSAVKKTKKSTQSASPRKGNGTHRPKGKPTAKVPLTEEAARRLVLEKLGTMSQKQLFQLAIRAGIYTKGGKLTKYYEDDAS